MSEAKDNIIPERDISAEVDKLRDNLLRDIKSIHRETYEEVKEIMQKHNDEKQEESAK